MLSWRALMGAAAVSALAVLPAQARTILFLGSSFTYGAHSAAQHYHPELVKDLNGPDKFGETYAGVPAIFKQFTLEAGLNDYDVSSELVGGKGNVEICLISGCDCGAGGLAPLACPSGIGGTGTTGI